MNGTIFLIGGILIARPGQIASNAIAFGTPVTLELALTASRPLALGLVVALVLAAVIRESYPKAPPAGDPAS